MIISNLRCYAHNLHNYNLNTFYKYKRKILKNKNVLDNFKFIVLIVVIVHILLYDKKNKFNVIEKLQNVLILCNEYRNIFFQRINLP